MTSTVESARLRKFYFAVGDGKKRISTTADAQLFLNAIREQDTAQCVAHLLSKEPALSAVRKSLSIDLSDNFLNGPAAAAIFHLVNEDSRNLNGGKILYGLLQEILTPPFLFNALKDAAAGFCLSNVGVHAFAHLLLELLILSPPSSNLRQSLKIQEVAGRLLEQHDLLQSPLSDLRKVGYRLREVVHSQTSSESAITLSGPGPGGRHDNDFADFRKIAIFPTQDELLSDEPAFIQQADTILSTVPERRAAAHHDNQFRLLREDMLVELREDRKRAATSSHKGKRSGMRLTVMQLCGIDCGTLTRIKPATISFRCFDPMFKQLPEDKDERRKHFVQDKDLVRHGSFGCLVCRNEDVAYATIERDEDLLSNMPPIISLRISGDAHTRAALLKLKMSRPHEISFVTVDTPFFAYEPFLSRLQAMPTLPMAAKLLGVVEDTDDASSPFGLDDLAARISTSDGSDLTDLLGLPQRIQLDQAQIRSLAIGISRSISIIHGPPGTGKSLSGAITAKIFVENTTETVLVLCCTNHALDQFLEDIMDMGITEEKMLRLGSKSTSRTRGLTLYEQKDRRGRLSGPAWNLLNRMCQDLQDDGKALSQHGKVYGQWRCSDKDVLDAIEFSDEYSQFHKAMTVPEASDGMRVVGADGRAIDALYLLERWKQGNNCGVLHDDLQARFPELWAMSRQQRTQYYERLIRETIRERVSVVCDDISKYNEDYRKWASLRDTREAEFIKSKRLIGCTTNGAARYAEMIENARPGIIIVEEAGEVLESHILTAMSQTTKQLVLIGDHLQLRPKINNYTLSVEKGDGFDLNRSLFERLVVNGHSHITLNKQHRMRPEISTLVKRLMYPKLIDGPATLNRPNIRGLQSNVIFINHESHEQTEGLIKDRLDGNTKASRKNLHEMKMVLKIVRYLAQQGYGTEDQVVLTPYLGQLRLLIDSLKADHDPVLSDVDSHDLVKAGLLTPASANHSKRQLRMSTIDNFQGEESNIVIVSLTRSNKNGDIGFLSAAQRLNVLLSRARDGLILIGNADTFRSSKKGRNVWAPFFAQLIENGSFFDGLPVRCERHSDRQVTLRLPADFDTLCPDGGCDLPCSVMLHCQKHRCPDKCHQLVDHSQIKCTRIEETKCPQGHKMQWRCWQQSQPCMTCRKLEEEREARQTLELKLSQQREEKEREYLRELRVLEEEILQQCASAQDRENDDKRANMLEQKRKELAQAKRLAQEERANNKQQKNSLPQFQAEQQPEEPNRSSPAACRWDDQKRLENVDNEHIDSLMKMIGLESIKQQMLDLKDKIDTSLRQGCSLKDERFGVVLLGNPGTGKTTVARLYAKCLASMGAVSGSVVEETTASRLCTGGVPAFQKLIETLMKSGGGAIFIDEAYQLASGSNPGGKQILDALLDEVENLRGKVLFILAGYKEEMEQVFAHNPGLPSRFPHQFVFEDYTDDDLFQILEKQIQERYKCQMKAEGGTSGLFCRILARRVGRGRGRRGFGNARALENAFAIVRQRQAARIAGARRSQQQSDDFYFTKEDLIGPEPSEALAASQAWKKLESLIGLTAVKLSVKALMQSLRTSYERELREQPPLEFNLNRVFLGSPGTGKTTVAKLYGQILSDLGFLSNGQVVVKNPSDFVGDVIGASERNTRGILSSAVGKVLVIDEAYGLYGGSSSGVQGGDIYKTAVIDTIVAEVQSVPGDDRCVLLLGYKDQMETMMQNVNPGLTRRFPLTEAFVFEDFADQELESVMDLKIKQQGYIITGQGRKVFMEVMRRSRNKPHFGNAGEVDILLNTAKERQQKRAIANPQAQDTVLDAQDIDPDFDRGQRKDTSVRQLFAGTVGNEELINRLEDIQNAALNAEARGIDCREHVPFNYCFMGPPGTGKTTTARKMGRLYYDMGILASSEVNEISASELVGQYVGQTGPKVQQQLEKALGKVLFVDEAYRLAEGPFAREAIDEIVDCVTKPRFAKRLIIIFAGYDHDMERLMHVNRGLKSRFPETIMFQSLRPNDCHELLISTLTRHSYLEMSGLRGADDDLKRLTTPIFQALIQLGDWANARDVESLAQNIAARKLAGAAPTSEPLSISTKDILRELQLMLDQRRHQASIRTDTKADDPHCGLAATQECAGLPPSQSQAAVNTKPAVNLNTRIETNNKDQDESPFEDSPLPAAAELRDVGVSDEVWQELERAKKAVVQEAQLRKEVDQNLELLTEELENWEVSHGNGSFQEGPATELAVDNSLEQLRLQKELLRRKKEEELEALRRHKAELERRRAMEEKAQQKLREMGVCVAGFRWFKQGAGYRCGGGSHFVHSDDLR